MFAKAFLYDNNNNRRNTVIPFDVYILPSKFNCYIFHADFVCKRKKIISWILSMVLAKFHDTDPNIQYMLESHVEFIAKSKWFV